MAKNAKYINWIKQWKKLINNSKKNKKEIQIETIENKKRKRRIKDCKNPKWKYELNFKKFKKRKIY